ncbi:hypothetical protein Lste_1804 [Legionella steelei]|uniref:Uncharacterized protein n=1 Tax=Legionella steelei TaxID=947033 RepID=A0A0W0ZIN3_9GAMM|nr:hypothetical protein Lste_1804 [Legionella steelei]
MYGCMDVWMYGCMDVWMYGCMEIVLRSRLLMNNSGYIADLCLKFRFWVLDLICNGAHFFISENEKDIIY